MAFPENIRLIDPDDGSEKIVHINQVPTGIYVYGSVGNYMLGPWSTIDAWNYYAVRGPDAGTQEPEDGESVAIVHEGRIVQSYVLASGPGRWWPRIPEGDGPREIQRPRRRIRLAMMPSEQAYLQALFVTEEQHDVLKILARPADSFHSKTPGVWTPTSGWTWGTNSNTVRILRALEKKGFTRNVRMSEFEITPVGRQLVEEMTT